MPESKPFVRPQPNREEYNVNEIELFPRLNRKIYRQKHGEQAPPWDPQRPIQRWFDTVTPANIGGVFQYPYVGRDLLTRKPMLLKYELLEVLDMRTPNLPGVYDYPDWVPAPTTAYVSGQISSHTSPLSPGILSLASQADSMMRELGATRVEEVVLSAAYHFVYPLSEDRRVFNVVLQSGAKKNVGRLLGAKYDKGIGVPGEWQNTIANPVWLSEDQPTGEWDSRPEVPIPCRPLFGNEELSIGAGIVGMVVVKRRDLGEPTLRDVMRYLERIAEGLGVA